MERCGSTRAKGLETEDRSVSQSCKVSKHSEVAASWLIAVAAAKQRLMIAREPRDRPESHLAARLKATIPRLALRLEPCAFAALRVVLLIYLAIGYLPRCAGARGEPAERLNGLRETRR